MVRILCALGLTVLFAEPVLAHSTSAEADVEVEGEAPRNYVNLRVGAASSNEASKPELCFEGAPLSWLSLEACGTGSELLHNDPAKQIMHIRAKGRVADFALDDLPFEIFLGAGLAELQVGEDTLGIRFADTGPNRAETAGPEVSAHLRTLIDIGIGFEVVAEIDTAVAWFPNAPDLAAPQSELQPTIAVGLGGGF